jgi:hypothetical protein
MDCIYVRIVKKPKPANTNITPTNPEMAIYYQCPNMNDTFYYPSREEIQRLCTTNFSICPRFKAFQENQKPKWNK